MERERERGHFCWEAPGRLCCSVNELTGTRGIATTGVASLFFCRRECCITTCRAKFCESRKQGKGGSHENNNNNNNNDNNSDNSDNSNKL